MKFGIGFKKMNRHDLLEKFLFIKSLLRECFENNEHINKSVRSNHSGISRKM